MYLVKFIVIDHRAKRGTYNLVTYEATLEGTPPTDLGEIGFALHHERYGSRDKAHFVRVLGVQLEEGDFEEAEPE